MVPGTAALPGNLLEKLHVIRPDPRPTISKTLEIGPAAQVLSGPPGDSDAHYSCE